MSSKIYLIPPCGLKVYSWPATVVRTNVNTVEIEFEHVHDLLRQLVYNSQSVYKLRFDWLESLLNKNIEFTIASSKDAMIIFKCEDMFPVNTNDRKKISNIVAELEYSLIIS